MSPPDDTKPSENLGSVTSDSAKPGTSDATMDAALMTNALRVFRKLDPHQEEQRLESIKNLKLLDRDQEAVLAPFVAEAASTMHQPLAMVTLVLRNTQVFLATHGLEGWLKEAKGTPREWAFCHHVVCSGSSFIVEDASSHPLMADSPLVTMNGIRSYAGAPLKDEEGRTLGALCVLGHTPRHFEPEEIERLQELATEAARALQASEGHHAES
jgi:GAF domain-containing protein